MLTHSSRLKNIDSLNKILIAGKTIMIKNLVKKTNDTISCILKNNPFLGEQLWQ